MVYYVSQKTLSVTWALKFSFILYHISLFFINPLFLIVNLMLRYFQSARTYCVDITYRFIVHRRMKVSVIVETLYVCTLTSINCGKIEENAQIRK